MTKAKAQSTRVFIIAAPLLSWGLDRLVQSAHPRFHVIGTAESLDGALSLLERNPADVIVLSVDSWTTEDLGALCGMGFGKVLVLTDSPDQAALDSAVLAGVRGVHRASDPPEALLKAIEKVNEGQYWIDRSATGRIFLAMARERVAQASDPERAKIATLTVRERQTVAAVATAPESPGKVLADRLCISEHTLRNHLTAIYAKLGVCNRVDLFAYANRHGLASVPSDVASPRNGRSRTHGGR